MAKLTRNNSDSVEDQSKAVIPAQLDVDARRKFWAEKIKKESTHRNLISFLIETAFHRASKGVEITDDIRAKIELDSKLAHQALYGSCSVLVVVPDRGDEAWTLPGTIHCWDTKGGLLEVELDFGFDSAYDRLQLVKPEQLDIVTHEERLGQSDKKYTVSLHFEIYLEKSYIDELESINAKSAQLQQVMTVRVASSNRLEQAATAEDRGRLALDRDGKQQSQQFESSLDSNCVELCLCLHGFPLNQDLPIVGPFLELFWNKYVEKEDDGVTLEQCFQAAIDVTSKRFFSTWGESNHMQVAISILLHNGTRDIRRGFLLNARAIAAVTNFFEQWKAIRSNVQYDWHWNVIYELRNADEHTLVSYFRSRISCSCLADKHKEVKSMKKMGICCNPRCSLPARKLERSAMESCERCRLVHYCSRNCQKKHWKRHKDACLHSVSPESNSFQTQVAEGMSEYNAAYKVSVGLKHQLYLKKTCPLRYKENGVIVAETHQPRRKEKLEIELKRLEHGLNVSEAKRGEAWRVLLSLWVPKVDYSSK